VKKPKKNPQSANAAGSDKALPSRPWKGSRKERSMQIDGLPALRTLEFELNILRGLLARPDKSLFYSPRYTLAKNRWIGFERVARAAMREGYTPADASRLLMSVHAECAGDDYRFTAASAVWVVTSQCEAPKSWVIAPATNKRPRIVGVTA
jgi:hypothetical protein